MSVERVKEWFNKIATPRDLKELKLYDTEHYVMSDGLIYEQVIADQIEFLDKLFKWVS